MKRTSGQVDVNLGKFKRMKAGEIEALLKQNDIKLTADNKVIAVVSQE